MGKFGWNRRFSIGRKFAITEYHNKQPAKGLEMKAYSKEFDEAMEFFERCVSRNTAGNYRFDKPTLEERKSIPAGEWYNHGETNRSFHVFLHGVEFGKIQLPTTSN